MLHLASHRGLSVGLVGMLPALLAMLISGCGDATPEQKTVKVRELLAKKDGEGANRLLNGGADPWDTDAAGGTLLHLAAAQGLVPAATTLVAKGVDVNAKTKEGVTPLYEAVSGGHEAMVELLLKCQADPNLAPAGKPTALALAKEKGLSKMAQALQAKGAK